MTTDNIINCCNIAGHYGYDSQSRQLIEEMAELTHAINRHWRNGCGKETEANVIEEIADVEICLLQIKFLLQCGTKVQQVQDIKIKRQLDRIEKNER